MAGCAADGGAVALSDAPDTAVAEEQKSSASQTVTKPTKEMVTVNDPVENCFTMQAPKGWYTRAYMSRAFDMHREVVTCVSPNNDTVIFLGDPNIPQYWSPQYAQYNPFLNDYARVNQMVRIKDYVDAADYFPDYVKRKFGKLEGFKLGKTTVNEETLQQMKDAFAKAGVPFGRGNVVDQSFSYTDHGKTMSCLVVGMTVDGGNFWQADVSGISTAGKVEDFRPMLRAIAGSKKTNPEWRANENAKHQQRMAEMAAFTQRLQAQHNQNMAILQASAERHQQRMQAMWAANDASVQKFYERSASSDLQHQRFLNYINDENTVSDSSGKTWQVMTGFDRYFVNKDTGKYLGGDINFDSEAIRRMGMNPDDYSEVKIRK